MINIKEFIENIKNEYELDFRVTYFNNFHDAKLYDDSRGLTWTILQLLDGTFSVVPDFDFDNQVSVTSLIELKHEILFQYRR